MAEKWPRRTCPSRGPMRHWHTVGLDIPRPVARLQGRTPLLQARVIVPGEGRDTTNGRWPGGDEVRVQEASGQDRERDSGCLPGSDMAQCDAAGVTGSNRILFHGAPRSRMMPNGCLGSPVLVLLFGLDRGFLMDVGPKPGTRWAKLAEHQTRHPSGKCIVERSREGLIRATWQRGR